MGRKIAVVLFNLGGPDGPNDIRPFLKNLFRDPAIIRAPSPIRWMLSEIISRTRAPAVKKNYAMMDAGGGSPLLPETEKQAAALELAMQPHFPGDELKCFIAMRYWHPFTEEAAQAVQAWGADEVILLPLYPQFSTTTTGSSLTAWHKAYSGPSKTICCYPFEDTFVAAHVGLIDQAWKDAGCPGDVTLLLSAHGLPENIVKDGDPYQWQCEEMAAKISALVPEEWEVVSCYQSRVGPLKWIGPPTEDEIEKAAKAKRNILIAPIAFVSEHIETLVELGEEYREVAEEHGAPSYTTVPALGTNETFINYLAGLVRDAVASDTPLRSCSGGRICPGVHGDCPHAKAAVEPGA